MTLGERIVELRERQGLTQSELAYKSYISPCTLCQIEKGNKSTSLTVLRCIANSLNMTMSELLEGVE